MVNSSKDIYELKLYSEINHYYNEPLIITMDGTMINNITTPSNTVSNNTALALGRETGSIGRSSFLEATPISRNYLQRMNNAQRGNSEPNQSGDVIKPKFIKVINTQNSSFNSPDPAGLTFLKDGNGKGRLLIADSEVNETSLFQGNNIFELQPGGSATGRNSSTDPAFSDEPTGITRNPSNGHFFITDDNGRAVYETDKDFNLINQFDISSFSDDPEGIAFDTKRNILYIASGADNKIHKVSLDGKLLGSFSTDTTNIGVESPEGIVYQPETDHLFIVGKDKPKNSHKNQVAEISVNGSIIRHIDISMENSEDNPKNSAGLALGPISNTGRFHLYVAARGFDNNTAHPNENDGKIFDFTLPKA